MPRVCWALSWALDIISFNLHSNPMKQVLFFTPNLHIGDWGTQEILSYWPKITQLVILRARIQTEIWLESSCSESPSTMLFKFYDIVYIKWNTMFSHRAFNRIEFRSRLQEWKKRNEINSDLNSSHAFFVSLIKAMDRKTILRGIKNIWLRDDSRCAG